MTLGFFALCFVFYGGVPEKVKVFLDCCIELLVFVHCFACGKVLRRARSCVEGSSPFLLHQSYLPSLKLTQHLKMDGWKLEDNFPFWKVYYQWLCLFWRGYIKWVQKSRLEILFAFFFEFTRWHTFHKLMV